MDIAAKAYWTIVEQLYKYARGGALPPMELAHTRRYVLAITGTGESRRDFAVRYSNVREAPGLSYSIPAFDRSQDRQLAALETGDGGIALRDGSETLTVGEFVDKSVRIFRAESVF